MRKGGCSYFTACFLSPSRSVFGEILRKYWRNTSKEILEQVQMKRAKDEEPLARILHHVFCRLLKYSKLNIFWRNIEKYWIKRAEKN